MDTGLRRYDGLSFTQTGMTDEDFHTKAGIETAFHDSGFGPNDNGGFDHSLS